MSANRKITRVLIVLAFAQLVNWGTISLPAIIGRQISADLRMDMPLVFAGNSVLYVVMGLMAPMLAKAFARFGARRLMIVGSVVAAPGFVALALSSGPVLYFIGWAILGAAGSATLTTAAYILLNEIAGRDAKSAIGALMLVTGLSSSVFWPITAFLSDIAGWRSTCLIYAAVMVLICLPLYAFGLPRREKAKLESGSSAAVAKDASVLQKSTFYLIAAGTAMNAFVTFGMSAVLIELLKAEGLATSEAIAFGSALGVIQVSARGIDFIGGSRWDGITTGLIAGMAIACGMTLLIVYGQAYWSIAAFILLYGLGSGALAVARATIPLVFYDRADYTRALSHIALPINVIAALSPPLLVALLTNFGSNAVLGLATLCSLSTLFILWLLGRRRPQLGTVTAA